MQESLAALPLAKVAVASPSIPAADPGIMGSLQMARRQTKSWGARTATERLPVWPPRPRLWLRRWRDGAWRPWPFLGALLVLIVPKLAFMFLRLATEYFLHFILANLHDTMVHFAGEANTLVINLVASFEDWLIFGRRPQRQPNTRLSTSAPLMPSGARAAVQAVAKAANLSQDLA